MSRRASILESRDVPAYIREIVARLRPVLVECEAGEGNWWGYTFELRAKWKCGYEAQLAKDTEHLLKWCESWHAYARLIRYSWWHDEIAPPSAYASRGGRRHMRKALREGFHNSAFLVISDPVAHRFEKDAFYRA